MVIILYASKNDIDIDETLGHPDYSYYFVLKEFRPALEKLGAVVTVRDPRVEVDALFTICRHLAEPCVFLSFTPPHDTLIDLACPTIPVFAWEFYDIPDETWDREARNDWHRVLSTLGHGITHSTFAATAVRKSLGADFPVASIPAPVWDRFARLCENAPPEPVQPDFRIQWHGKKTDSRDIAGFSSSPSPEPDSLSAEVSIDLDALSEPDAVSGEKSLQSVQISGVVYTSVLNPNDGRKNWFEMIRTFCYALRDCADANLLLKLTHSGLLQSHWDVHNELRRLMPFRCRVIVIDGFLDDTDYEKLILHSTYAVNASLGEGQCLPLMEYMSCGRPAIAPHHTGMADYVDADNGFLIDSSLEPCTWPQDPRSAYRSLRHRINAESLMKAFEQSYQVAMQDPDRYRSMSEKARRRLQQHCSEKVVESNLRVFLQARLEQQAPVETASIQS